jgi:large subunit ribosomal protein L23
MKSPVRTRKTKESVAKSAAPQKTPKLVKYFTLKPRVSEKAYGLSEARNTYVFDVGSKINKFDISAAVAAQYEVGVVKVRLVSVPGKSTRSYRQRGRKSFNGQRSDIRKAYVTLKEGDKLPIFAAVEEPEAPKENK